LTNSTVFSEGGLDENPKALEVIAIMRRKLKNRKLVCINLKAGLCFFPENKKFSLHSYDKFGFSIIVPIKKDTNQKAPLF